MEKFIVKYRKFILILAAILLIPALIGMFNTRINYDLLTYLPDNMETVKGQDELLNEFGKGAFAIIITEDLNDEQEQSLENDLKQIPHVDTVLGFGTLTDNNLPAKIIPDDYYEKFTPGTEKLTAVFFDTSTSADETLNAVTKIRETTDGHAHISGMSAFSTDLKNLSEEEEIFYVIIAASLALLIMLAFLDNWLAPVLFLVSIGAMILSTSVPTSSSAKSPTLPSPSPPFYSSPLPWIIPFSSGIPTANTSPKTPKKTPTTPWSAPSRPPLAPSSALLPLPSPASLPFVL